MAKAKTQNKKYYYKKLITDHKSILAKARTLIGVLLDKLEKEINEYEDPKNEEAKRQQAKFWWGDKESASTILTRLTTILLKLIPLEQEIARLDLSRADLLEMEEVLVKTQIPEEDIRIVEEYIERYNANNS